MTRKTRTTLLKWLALTCLIAYTVVMTAWAMQCDATQRCVGIEVQIDSHAFMGDTITRKGVISELARYDKKLIGKRLSDINTRGIERFLISFSNFETVECFTTSHGRLRIVVTPVIPEIRVFDGDQSYYVNKDGKRIDANAKFYCDVPIVTGRFNERFKPTALLPVTRRIANDSIFKHLVMMVKADDPNDIILVPRIAGHVINIGDATNLDQKFHNILLAYREIMPYQGWEKYDTISVKFDGRIVASRRDKTTLTHTPDFEQNVDFDEDAAENVSAGTEEAAAEMAANANSRTSSTKKQPAAQPQKRPAEAAKPSDTPKPTNQPLN